MLKLAILLIILLIFGGAILRLLAKLFLYALGLTFSVASFFFKCFCVFFGVMAGVIFLILQKLVPFAVKHLSRAITWIIAAIVTAGLLIYAAGRNIFHGENILDFIKNLIPNKRVSINTDFSLLLIELADAVHSDIISKFNAQYETILDFFKPIDDEQKN